MGFQNESGLHKNGCATLWYSILAAVLFVILLILPSVETYCSRMSWQMGTMAYDYALFFVGGAILGILVGCFMSMRAKVVPLHRLFVDGISLLLWATTVFRRDIYLGKNWLALFLVMGVLLFCLLQDVFSLWKSRKHG